MKQDDDIRMCDYCEHAAAVIAPGSDPERSTATGIVTRREVPMRCWCMPCAVGAGWPWLAGERGGKARA